MKYEEIVQKLKELGIGEGERQKEEKKEKYLKKDKIERDLCK